MKERRILFNAHDVRAILSSNKTQTRRVMKVQPDQVFKDMAILYTPQDEGLGRLGKVLICPYGAVGDRLWVSEAFQPMFQDEIDDPRDERLNYKTGDGYVVYYPATDMVLEWYDETNERYTSACQPSIFMPRWASRITLEITDIHVERLNDISRGDCMAEGCPFPNIAKQTDPVKWYKELWESRNGAGSWDKNPWVWAVTFKQIEN